jgi:hypothetical protein
LKLIKHTSIFLQSWRWGIGRGLTSGIARASLYQNPALHLYSKTCLN